MSCSAGAVISREMLPSTHLDALACSDPDVGPPKPLRWSTIRHPMPLDADARMWVQIPLAHIYEAPELRKRRSGAFALSSGHPAHDLSPRWSTTGVGGQFIVRQPMWVGTAVGSRAHCTSRRLSRSPPRSGTTTTTRAHAHGWARGPASKTDHSHGCPVWRPATVPDLARPCVIGSS